MSIRQAIARRLRAIGDRRPPDFVIGGQADPYLRRWFVIPRNRVFNIYLHQFLRSDDDRALHDHPWAFNASWLLSGGYIEHTPDGQHARREGAFKLRLGAAPHRVELLSSDHSWQHAIHGTHRRLEQPVWTLFITGPRIRQWGFYCPQGWRHWKEFTSRTDSGAVGRGCE